MRGGSPARHLNLGKDINTTLKRAYLAVIAAYLVLYIIPLGVRPLFIPDETRYAEIPREMIATGDWVVPRLNGLRYFEKPVFGYWLDAASILAFGQNAFAVRFPSAIADGLSAFMLFLLVRRFSGSNTTGLWAAVSFLTCLEAMVIGDISTLDSMLAMFVTLSMVSFFFAHSEARLETKVGFFILFGIACGLAFLTKGFIGFAIPVMAIIPFLIWEGRLKELFGFPWISIAAAGLVVLPWCLMIHFRESDFWHYFFWSEHIKRFMSDSAQHAKPFWYYIPVFLGGALPWTFLLPAAAAGLKNNPNRQPLVRFFICWFVFPFIFFSVSKGKLGTYILPCFPALAGLLAFGLWHSTNTAKIRLFNMGTAMLAALTAAVAVVLTVSQLVDLQLPRAYSAQETWKWMLAAAGMATWAAFLWFALKAVDLKKKLVWFSVAPLVFLLLSHFIMPELVVVRKAPGAFMLRQAGRIGPDTVLVADKDLAGAACWFYKRKDVFVLGSSGEMSYGLGYDDAGNRLLDINQFKALIQNKSRTNAIVLLARSKHYRTWKASLPEPLLEESNGPHGCCFAQF